jgi:hypothetical protein
MTDEQFRDCLDVLQIGTGTMADWLNADDRLVRRWYSGKRAIPTEVSEWIEGLMRYLDQAPGVRGRTREVAE